MSKRPTLEDLGVLPPGAVVKGIAIPVAGEKPKVKRSKYNAKPTVYNDVRYASKAEATYASMLDYEVSIGAVLWWIGQPVFRLGCPENRYVADMLVVTPEGVHVIDVKGQETAKFKRDKKLWAAYGPCELRIVRKGWVGEVVRPAKQGVSR